MVMAERERRRETFLLKRGAYDAPGEHVEPGTPAVLPPFRDGWPANRLGLARWLVDRESADGAGYGEPLLADVLRHRLVKTVEDFGSQGEWPVHTELLDWLAVEFMDRGWDVKAILKTIVMTATYRQSSKVTPELLAEGPGEPAARARRSFSPVAGSHPRSGAGRLGSAGGEDRRALGEAVSAAGTVAGTCGRPRL